MFLSEIRSRGGPAEGGGTSLYSISIQRPFRSLWAFVLNFISFHSLFDYNITHLPTYPTIPFGRRAPAAPRAPGFKQVRMRARRGGKLCHWGTRLSPRSHGPVFCRVRARSSSSSGSLLVARAPCLKETRRATRMQRATADSESD